MATTKNDKNDTEQARRMAALMDAADLTPEELAKRMKIGRSTAYAWRNGTRIPSRHHQTKLAKQLGVTVAKLNGWAA